MFVPLLLGALLASPPASGAASDPVSPVRPGVCTLSLEVVVLESETGELIPSAQLAVRTPDGGRSVFVRTDVGGRARIDNLCAGTIQVTAVKAEHSSRQVDVELVTELTKTVLELDALHDHHDERVIVVHDEGSPSLSSNESLSGSELSRRRGAGLADVLSGVSGVSTLRGTAGGMGKPIIRGQFGRRNMVIFDGIRHEGQEWGIDHAPEVDPQAADRITVIKGAGTTRFGSEAIGGVVLLEPRPLPRMPSLRGEVGSFGYSNPLGGGGSFRLDYAPKRGKGLAMRVEGNLARHRAALTPDYPLDNTGSTTWNAGGRLGYASDPVDVEVGYHLMRAELGICTCLQISTIEEFQSSVGRSEPVAVDLYRADFEIERPRQEIWHHLALARARVALGGAEELHATYSYQFNDRREFAIVRESVVGPQLEFQLATHSLDARYEHAAITLRRWTLVGTLGVGLTQQHNEFEAATTLVPDYDQWSWSVYDIERFVHDRVEIEIGARYEGLHRTAALRERDYLGQQAGGRLDAGACVATNDGGGVCKHLFNTGSATFGVLGRPVRAAPDFTIRAQLDSSARIPAIDEHFMNGAAPSFPILGIGDSRLGVERTWGGELTLQYAGDWWFVEASGFSSLIDDYIYFVAQQQEGQCAPLTCTTHGAFPVFVFEPTDALFGGGEVRFDLRAPRLPFGLTGSGAWVRARDLELDGALAFMPADRYSLTGRYFFPDSRITARGYLELGGTVVARQTRYQPELDFAPPPPAYVLLGAGAGIEFLTEQQVVRLNLTGTNLLDMRYRDFNSLLRYFADEPGWGLQLRLAVEFDVPIA